jgi:membrane associated rhomboid family serine protease
VIPIGDDNSDRRLTPLVNWLLIAINVFVFVALQGLGSNERFTMAFATIPAEILTGRDIAEPVPIQDSYGRVAGEIDLQPTPIPVYLTLITALFMHGGVAHIFGNMLYLVIFGDNVEDAMGHGRYLVFYLTCGVLASLSHVAATAVLGTNPLVPSLGASGAISGVLAGYVVLYPRRRVRILWLFSVISVPAIFAIGFWFAFQLVSGVGMLGGRDYSGVAYAAHIGGFFAGVVLVKLFARGPGAGGDAIPPPRPYFRGY